jgi:hypothetical protein
MARLFISHSSRNNDKAIEVRDWLAANGWDDVFLDLDPERGIVAGQRWKEALQKAAHRCEVVLALVTADWLASGWCKSEIDAARLMGKKIIVSLIGIDKSQVPVDLADEQWIDLTSDPQAYRRLKEGLKRAGLDALSFPFEPGRRPYPGFAYLEEKDAAVFFGRDAQIVRGLDEIRRLVRTGVSRMLVILGASGSGKSSFLRAGLWPRLKRDDRTWLPLPIIRPERAVISGTYGLAQALQQVVNEAQFADGIRQRGLPRSRADIQDFIEKTEGGLGKLFDALRDIAQVPGLAGETPPPPTIVVALDQGEELFNEEGRDEARRICDILTATLKSDPHTLGIFVVRSDSFPRLQADPSLAALPKDTFTLDMMLAGSYRAVIEEPARLIEPTPLRIDPQLTDALLKDISGQDALPLLAFALAKLYELYAADNELSLSGYDRLGGLKGVIDTAVKQAFAEGVAKGDVPRDVKAQLALARAAFIPHLAQVNPGGQFVRRVAARDQIPAGARPLIDRFADQRLLIRDRRQDAEVIEVAHEALLRQPPFIEWLEEDREFLMWRERLSQARAAFAANERGLLAGRELQIACGWVQTRAKDAIDPADQAFIGESIAEDDKRRADEAEQERKRQAAEKEEQERRTRDAERIAAARRRTAQVSFAGLVVAVLVAAAAVAEYFAADRAKMTAEAERDRATQARDLAAFSVTTANQIAGPVSGQLLRLTETARAAINVTSPLDREFAYLDIARYYVAAWQNAQAKEALQKIDEYTKQVPLSDNPDRRLKRLRILTNEIYGDMEPLGDGDQKYRAALAIIEGVDETEPDLAEIRARLLRKMADVELIKGNVAAAGRQLSAAQSILDRHPEPWALHESAVLAATRARFFVQQGLLNEANLQYRHAVEFLRKAHDAEPLNNLISLELATTLQNQGDAQRQLGDPNALTTYNTTLELLDKIVTDDPTSFAALSAIDLTHHGISMLEGVPNIVQKRDEVRSGIDSAFGAGLGKFRFGMTISEANKTFRLPFDDVNGPGDLPRAPEYLTGAVRYLWKNFKDEPDLGPFPLSACVLKSGYVIMFFHDGLLFRIELRFFPKGGAAGRDTFSALDSCEGGAALLETFAKQYGLSTTGSIDYRRFQYEAQRVAVTGLKGPTGVTIRFNQR